MKERLLSRIVLSGVTLIVVTVGTLAFSIWSFAQGRLGRGWLAILSIMVVATTVFAGQVCFHLALPLRQFLRRISEWRVNQQGPSIRELQGEREGLTLAQVEAALYRLTDQVAQGRRGDADKHRLERDVVRLLGAIDNVTRGDLTVRGSVQHDALGPVNDGFNYVVENVGAFVAKVREATGEVGHVAELVRSSSVAVAHGAADETALLENAGEKIRAINECTLEINQVVELIKEVASEMNLVTLNATIQATRTGMQGPVLSHIVDEMRNLAERSTDSGRKINAFVETTELRMRDTAVSMETLCRIAGSLAEDAAEAILAVEHLAECTDDLQGMVSHVRVDAINEAIVQQA